MAAASLRRCAVLARFIFLVRRLDFLDALRTAEVCRDVVHVVVEDEAHEPTPISVLHLKNGKFAHRLKCMFGTSYDWRRRLIILDKTAQL